MPLKRLTLTTQNHSDCLALLHFAQQTLALEAFALEFKCATNAANVTRDWASKAADLIEILEQDIVVARHKGVSND